MTQPQAIELERAVLGAMMLNKDALYVVSQMLDPDSFYDERHRIIFEAAISLYEKSKPVDILTVCDALKNTQKLEVVGGAYEVSKLTDSVASVSNVEHHCAIVQEKYMLRRWVEIAAEAQSMVYQGNSPFDVDEFVVSAQMELTSKVSKGQGVKTMKDISPEVLEAIDRGSSAEGLTGITTGIQKLDSIFGGRQDSDLIINAARPAMGKTSKMICEALAAARAGKDVLIFSCEMSALQLAQRILSIETGASIEDIRRGNLLQGQLQAIHQGIGKMEGLSIYICDKANIDIRTLISIAMRQKQREKCDLIMIDYLQLVTVKDGNRSTNREQEVSSISRRLKGLAKDLNVPVVALAQLSRAVETRGGLKKPMLSDLRESGSIEQDADVVEFLWRPEYYGINEWETYDNTLGLAVTLIEKNRNGRTGMVPMRFIAENTKFMDYE